MDKKEMLRILNRMKEAVMCLEDLNIDNKQDLIDADRLIDVVKDLGVVGRSEQLFCHTCNNEMPENEAGNCCSKCWIRKYGAK